MTADTARANTKAALLGDPQVAKALEQINSLIESRSIGGWASLTINAAELGFIEGKIFPVVNLCTILRLRGFSADAFYPQGYHKQPFTLSVSW
jgi:hypothetical protein